MPSAKPSSWHCAVCGRGAAAFYRQAQGHALTAEELEAATAYLQSFPNEATILSMGAGPAAGLPCSSAPGRTFGQAAADMVAQAATGPYLLDEVFRDAERRMLQAGVNPGGYSNEALWTDHENQRGSWRDLFDWTGPAPGPRYAGLTPQQQTHLTRLRQLALAAVVNVVFASGRRGLESLQIAHASVLGGTPGQGDALVCQAADSALRLLGERRRVQDPPYTAVGAVAAPGFLRDYLAEVARVNGRNPAAFETDVTARIQSAGLVTSFLYRSNGSAGSAPQARVPTSAPAAAALYLHPSGSVCTDCQGQLGPAPARGQPRRDR